MLLLKVLDELLKRQVALDEEAAKATSVSGVAASCAYNQASGTYRSHSVNSVSRYCSDASDEQIASSAAHGCAALTFIFCAAMGFENANKGNAKLMKALWNFSMSVLPSMSCIARTVHVSTGWSAPRVDRDQKDYLVELDVDKSSDASRRRRECRDNFAGNTLGGVTVSRLDAVVERTAVGCQSGLNQYQARAVCSRRRLTSSGDEVDMVVRVVVFLELRGDHAIASQA